MKKSGYAYMISENLWAVAIVAWRDRNSDMCPSCRDGQVLLDIRLGCSIQMCKSADEAVAQSIGNARKKFPPSDGFMHMVFPINVVHALQTMAGGALLERFMGAKDADSGET